MEKLFVLNNGVVKYGMELENDFDLAQSILDMATATENIDAGSAYNRRVETDLIGTYAIKVERMEDFYRFENMLSKEKNHFWSDISKQKDAVFAKYREDKISRDEAVQKLNDLDEEYEKGCICKKCQFKISFDEWKSGKMENGAKVGKSLRKAGFSQTLIDFYSAQIKDECMQYLTISGNVQFIAGMSNFAEMDSWNGYGGTSCQDTRHDGHYCLNLGGALHDNKLFIAMLHDNLEDLEDMQDKLKARTLLRLFHVNDRQILVPSEYYGNNVTKSNLDYCLKQIEGLGIFSRDARDGYDYLEEKANGHFGYYVTDEVHVYETIDEYVDVECPMCGGSGEYEVYSSMLDRHVEVECPACGGNGEIEVNVYVDVDEWIEVEEEDEILPYADDYSHYGHKVRMKVSKEYIENVIGELLEIE